MLLKVGEAAGALQGVVGGRVAHGDGGCEDVIVVYLIGFEVIVNTARVGGALHVISSPSSLHYSSTLSLYTICCDAQRVVSTVGEA